MYILTIRGSSCRQAGDSPFCLRFRIVVIKTPGGAITAGRDSIAGSRSAFLLRIDLVEEGEWFPLASERCVSIAPEKGDAK